MQQERSPCDSSQREDMPLSPTSLLSANCMAVEAMLHSYVISYRMPATTARVTEGLIGGGVRRGIGAALQAASERNYTDQSYIISL